MKIAIGSDHAGFPGKETLRDRLAADGHELLDLGTGSTDSCDYPDFARAVAQAVADGKAERGILVCGSGTGMAMAANRIAGVRAVQAWSKDIALLSRRHNDANVACFGDRLQGPDDIAEITAVWLAEPFEGGRHARRVDKMG